MFEFDRRTLLAGAVGAMAAGLSPDTAQARSFSIQRQLALQMARNYQLHGERRIFRELFDTQSTFLGLQWPTTEIVVDTAVAALSRVIAGETVDKLGYARVERRPITPAVVFSDHHILPDDNRQSAVWRANRRAYTALLRHYANQGRTIVENGDVEDLVILEPRKTARVYENLQRLYKGRNPRGLVRWYREDPQAMLTALIRGRRTHRWAQLRNILREPKNQSYYDLLAELANAGQLVRIAGNHDYEMQQFELPDHLSPYDILLLGPFSIMHGHQFDQATTPGIAPLYGEVVSECLGVWYEGPDRSWGPGSARRIREGGFPNGLSTHLHHSGGTVGTFVSALLRGNVADDQVWARAWEGLFGHPIAWEYGAPDWGAAVRGQIARPRSLVDQAMNGRQFFKFRHLDEVALIRGMEIARLETALVLGHSHEVRYHPALPQGGPAYFNSGAAGRFEKLIWALELDPPGHVNVVGWFERDGVCSKVLFHRRESDLSSYFAATPTDEHIVLSEAA